MEMRIAERRKQARPGNWGTKLKRAAKVGFIAAALTGCGDRTRSNSSSQSNRTPARSDEGRPLTYEESRNLETDMGLGTASNNMREQARMGNLGEEARQKQLAEDKKRR